MIERMRFRLRNHFQHLTKRQIKRGKSVVQAILGTATTTMSEDNRDELTRTKNIKQTEILVDLREAILQVRDIDQIK